MSFADDLAEQSFGFYGKPSFSDMSLKQPVQLTSDIAELCKNVLRSIEYIETEYRSKSEYSDIVSLIDDFKGEMRKSIFLSTFDKVSQFKK